MRIALLLAIGLSIGSAGCATVVGGHKDKQVTIASEPPGAAVLVDGQPYGATPAVVKLSRKSDHQVVISQPGYETATMTVRQKFNPWVLGNIVFGGLIGIVVDVCTDATHTLSPDEITVKLKPAIATPLRAPATPQAAPATQFP